MITVVHGVGGIGLGSLGGTLRGTLGGPLDAGFTIPGVGVRVTLRGLLQTVCQYGNVDPTICKIVTSNPTAACKLIVAKGESWITAQVTTVISKIVGKAMENVTDCSTNWRDIIAHSVQFSMNDDGIEVSVNTAELVKDLFCVVGEKVLKSALQPAIRQLAKNLAAACGKLSSSSGSRSPVQASSGSARSPVAPSGSTSAVVSTAKPGSATSSSSTAASSSWLTTSSSSASAYAKVIKSVDSAKSSAPSSTGTVLLWTGGGLAVAGITWWALSRR